MRADTQPRRGTVTQSNLTIAWVLLVVGIVLAVAGQFFNWYTSFWWFDEVTHLYNFFALALVAGLYLYRTVLTGVERHGVLLVLVVAAVGLAFGALWEVAEFIYDWFFRPQVSTIKSVPDRLIDLILDSAGALVAGWLALWMARK